MLVLSRKIGEEILVPEFGIAFKILEIRGSQVRVGVTAPSDVDILRAEICERQREFAASQDSVELTASLDSSQP